MSAKSTERSQALLCIKRVYLNKTSLSYALQDTTNTPFIKVLCFGFCRHYTRLEIIADSLMGKRPKDIDVWLCIMIGLYELYFLSTPDYAAVQETVALSKKPWAKRFINAVLRRYCREREQLNAKLALNLEFQLGHPNWLVQRIKDAWPQCWQNILHANDKHPPMTLRVNSNFYTRDDYLKLLLAQGVDATPHQYAKTGLNLTTPIDVKLLPEFDTGRCSVQDGAAQLARELLAIEPNNNVLDACCAPGGKLGHLLETTDVPATFIGLDIDAKRLLRVQSNLARLKKCAHLVQGDAAHPEQWWDGKYFDRILLDAPCSAIGVIRRHPDIKLLRTKDEIFNIVQLQYNLLRKLWHILASNGRMVYATCSILPEENELQIAKFAQETPDCNIIRQNISGAIWTGHGLQILPGNGDMDGFFYSVMHKIS